MNKRTFPSNKTFKRRKLFDESLGNDFSEFIKETDSEITNFDVLEISEEKKTKQLNLVENELKVVIETFSNLIDTSKTFEIVHFLNFNSRKLNIDISIMTSQIFSILFSKKLKNEQVSRTPKKIKFKKK